jgi:hypothetical protein
VIGESQNTMWSVKATANKSDEPDARKGRVSWELKRYTRVGEMKKTWVA